MSEIPQAAEPQIITRAPKGGWLLLEAERCPLREQHTPAPNGYIQWHKWAEEMMAKGRRQHRCAGCHRWSIWLPVEPSDG